MDLKNGPGYSKKFRENEQMIEVFFPSSKHKRNKTFIGMVYLLKSLKEKVIRPYDEIYPIVQQSHLNSCWINSILVALMYCYKLNKLLENLIIEQTQIEKKQHSLARIIPEKLLELLILQYKDNGKMKPKECILLESFFVRDFITLLTTTEPDLFYSKELPFSQVIKDTEDTDLNDIILYKGGTKSDIFNFIRILLESGLEFKYRLDSVSDQQFYYKIKNKNKITICVTKKKLSENYRDKIKSFDVHGFKFASMILWDYKDPNDINDLEFFMDNEEEEVGHVITVVTDSNDKEYFYNGWMIGNCANPFKKVLNNHIELFNGRITYKFDLLKSLGIMIFYKKEIL